MEQGDAMEKNIQNLTKFLELRNLYETKGGWMRHLGEKQNFQCWI